MQIVSCWCLAFSNGEREHLIRIIVSEGIASPKVERGESQTIEVWVSPEMSFQGIESYLQSELTLPELQAFKKLWTDDDHLRKFIVINDNLEIEDLK